MRPFSRPVLLVIAVIVSVVALLWLLTGHALAPRTAVRDASERGSDAAARSQSLTRDPLAATAAPVISAEQPTWAVGSLAGRVVDADGHVIAGARIAIEHSIPGADYLPRGVDITWEADWDRAQDFRREHGAEIDARLAPVASDADGRFRCDALPVLGCLAVRVEKAGFASFEARGYCVFAAATLDLGTLTLLPEASVAGRVVDDQGDPVPSVRVHVEVANSWRRVAHDADADADGSFRCGGLIGGETRITAVCEGRTLWPHVLELMLDDGERRDGLELTLQRDLPITGAVRDPRGTPIARARVTVRVATEQTQVSVPDVVSDEDGRFVVRGVIAAHRYVLGVYAPGYRYADRKDVAAGSNDVVIEISRSPAIEVVTRDAISGAAIVPRQMIVERAATQRNRPASKTEYSADRWPGWREAEPHRHFLPHGSAGAFTVEARASGYLDGRSEPIAGDGVADCGPIVVRLMPAPRIEGVVRRAGTGLPVPRARVELSEPLPPRTLVSVRHHGVTVRDERRLIKITRTDREGTFCFALDGESCFDRRGEREATSEPSAKSYSLRVTAPDLAPKLVERILPSAGMIVIELGTGGAIEGTVTGLDGSPAAGAVIVASMEDGTCRSGRSEASGRYSVGPLAAGRYRVSVGDAGMSEQWFFSCGNVDVPEPDASLYGIAVEAGRATRADLDLRRPLDGAAVAGRITVKPARENLTISLLADTASKDVGARHDYATTQLRPDGSYALFGVIAGHRTLIISGRRDLPIATRDLDLVNGETARVDFTIDLATLRGTVVDATTGRALCAQATLRFGTEPRVQSATMETDLGGAFAFADLGVNASYELELQCHGYYPEPLTVTPGLEAAEMRIAMWPPGHLDVHVTGAHDCNAVDLKLFQNGERVDTGWSRPSDDTFRLDAVHPGMFGLVVTESVGGNERTARATVTIESGQNTEVSVTLP